MNKCALLLLSLASPSIFTMEMDNTDRLWRIVLEGTKNKFITNCIKDLLATGTIDFNSKKKDEDITLLNWAIITGDHNLCTLLIEYGAPINEQDKQGNTPLILACNNNNMGNVGDIKICNLLLKKGAAIHGSKEFEAIFSRHPHYHNVRPKYELIGLLLSYGANPHINIGNRRLLLHLAYFVYSKDHKEYRSAQRAARSIIWSIINKNRHNAQTFMRCLCHLGNSGTNASIKEGARLLSKQGPTLLKPYVTRILFEESCAALLDELNQWDTKDFMYTPRRPFDYWNLNILDPKEISETMAEFWRKY